MKRFVLVAVSAMLVLAIVAASGGADPGQNPNGPKQDGGHGHWFKRACDVTPAKLAACDAQVVTDSAGKPLATSTSPSGYGPAQFHGAYSLPTTAGSSQTIGIVDAYDDPNIEADLAQYSAAYGLPPCASGCFRKVDQTGGTNYPAVSASWSLEIALDVETAHQICQNCDILLVEASSNSMTDLGAAENEAVALGANVISNSWGGSEFSGETSLDGYFNHPGVVITVSSGDNGYGVEYPAASRYVTAVGGTTLNLAGSSWASETAWAGAGSGCSAYESKPSWQMDSGCSRRTVADVSADADPNTGAAVYDSVSYQGQSGWFQVGGTSLAAPLIASVYALTGTASSANYGSTPYGQTAAVLHDVMSGSNGSCGSSYLCTAKSGYDGPTGLGTPNGLGAFTAGTPAGDFTLGVNPSSRTVAPGASASYVVSTSGQNGFSGAVDLNATGLPTGANFAFSPTSITTSTSSTLTVTTTTTLAAGSYPFTITGTSGGMTHSVPATLVVQAAAQTGDFGISVTPSTQSIGRNSTTSYTVQITPLSGSPGAVTLSASNSSSGLTESFSPNPTSSTSRLTVKAHGLARGQTYTVTITGTNGSFTHSKTLTLTT